MKKSKRPFKRWEGVIREDHDWDFYFLWKLEYTKICHMLKYWEDYRDEVYGKPKYKCTDAKTFAVIRDLGIAKALLEIMMKEDGEAWDIEFPGFDTEPVPGKPGCSRLVERDPQDPGTCKRLKYVNTRNAGRFLGTKTLEHRLEIIERENTKRGYPNHITCGLENDLRYEKARALYHRLRLYKETEWWE